MTSIHALKQRLLFFIITSAAIMCLPNLYAQTLIASYPLTTNSNDATGNLGPIMYGTTATQAPNACSDGTNSGYIMTPTLGSLLNTSNFQVKMTFTARNIPNDPRPTPVFMLDQSYRAFGVSYNSAGLLGVYWNNSNFATSATAIIANQTYTLTAKYVAPYAEVYLNDQLIQTMNVGTLTFNPNDWSYNLLTYNPGTGQYANECISNLLIYSGNVALPVTLSSFKAVAFGNNQALLEWQSEHEFAGEHFAIERSLDAREWMEIGTVAARGLKNTSSKYSFVDEAPVPGCINYYRLRYEQQTGGKSYTAVEKIQMGSHAMAYKVYPNPVTDMLHIINWNAGTAKVYELSGRAVMPLTVGSDGKTDVSKLKAGIYVLEIIAEGYKHYTRFQKL